MGAVIIVPIKSFDLAKGRLSDALSAPRRADLARRMAETVIAARGSLPLFVVCDDPAVAAFATRNGAGVLWRKSTGLNAAVRDGAAFAAQDGYDRVIVAHADLPLAVDLSWLGSPGGADVRLVPDRRHDGTNVLSLPTNSTFEFHYGLGSAAAHRHEAERLDLSVEVVIDEALGWDVDVPEDLSVLENGVVR